MSFFDLVFSTDGRINRVTFWKTWVVFLLLGWIGFLLIDSPDTRAAVVGWAIFAALIWPVITVSAKRWHDLDKAAWWCLLFLVPVVGQIWSLVCLGFFQGTSGPNRFGYPMDAPKSGSRTERRRSASASSGRRNARQGTLPASYPDLMAMFAKLAKCDGPINQAEISVVDSFLAESLALSEAERKEAIRKFRVAKDSRMSFETHSRRFYNHHSDHQHFLGEIVDMLVTLAMADGNLKRREVLFLDLVVALFGVSSRKYYQCKYGDTAPRVDDVSLPEEREYARILGLTGKVSREEIRKAYRGLVGQYHPDKVSHLGPRLREVAEQEIKRINEAYEFFRKKYDL